MPGQEVTRTLTVQNKMGIHARPAAMIVRISNKYCNADVWAEKDERFRFDRAALQKESIGGGWVTFSGKFCTEYGIATTAARMAYAVLHDEKVILPASTELCGEYGEEGLFAGVPCVIGENGVEQVVELPLTADEKATFHACCEGIRHNMEHLKEI